MQRFDVPNINTQEYWDNWYSERLRVDFVDTLRQDRYLQLVEPYRSVVELGCGTSSFLMRAANRGQIACGVDLSLTAIQYLERNYPQVTWKHEDALDNDLAASSFDSVVAGELIEHMEEPDSLLEEMDRICRDGGRIVLSTPRLEFKDPEHLWELDVKFFHTRSFETEIAHSEKFPGRSYIFAWRNK